MYKGNFREKKGGFLVKWLSEMFSEQQIILADVKCSCKVSSYIISSKIRVIDYNFKSIMLKCYEKDA